MKIAWDDFGRLVQMAINNHLKCQGRQAEALEIIANELMEINQLLKIQSSEQSMNSLEIREKTNKDE